MRGDGGKSTQAGVARYATWPQRPREVSHGRWVEERAGDLVEQQYRDEAARGAHESSAYGKNDFPRIRAILQSITVEYFDVRVP
jgi:hypothetical protein